VALRAVLKVSPGYMALALVLFALPVCGFTGGVKGKSRVCGSSTCVVCLAGMWLYGRC
jgi:energy-converting hydrogenase Eha subunit G